MESEIAGRGDPCIEMVMRFCIRPFEKIEIVLKHLLGSDRKRNLQDQNITGTLWWCLGVVTHSLLHRNNHLEMLRSGMRFGTSKYHSQYLNAVYFKFILPPVACGQPYSYVSL